MKKSTAIIWKGKQLILLYKWHKLITMPSNDHQKKDVNFCPQNWKIDPLIDTIINFFTTFDNTFLTNNDFQQISKQKLFSWT